MSTRSWIILVIIVGVAVAGLAFVLVPTVPGPRSVAAPEEQNAATTTAAEMDRTYEELRRSAEMNAQIAADERNMQINMTMDELNALAEPLPIEADAEPAN